jgi:uncharacterized LabA/DUF88 family protein
LSHAVPRLALGEKAAFWRFFRFSHAEIRMRTIVYVDGYNLFFSLLTKTSFKWLDLNRLFSRVVRPVEPSSEIALVKYFTAPILGSMASDPRAEQRQAHYHRALRAVGGIEIINGFHNKAITTGILVDPVPDMTSGQRYRIQVMEKKQTDVNIVLHMYRDAACRACDLLVLCSNDSDLEPVLAMIRTDLPDIRIGLVLPRSAENSGARRSGRLERHAHWTRHSIRVEELAGSQLPDRLRDHRNRTIQRPEEWRGSTDH